LRSNTIVFSRPASCCACSPGVTGLWASSHGLYHVPASALFARWRVWVRLSLLNVLSVLFWSFFCRVFVFVFNVPTTTVRARQATLAAWCRVVSSAMCLHSRCERGGAFKCVCLLKPLFPVPSEPTLPSRLVPFLIAFGRREHSPDGAGLVASRRDPSPAPASAATAWQCLWVRLPVHSVTLNSVSEHFCCFFSDSHDLMTAAHAHQTALATKCRVATCTRRLYGLCVRGCVSKCVCLHSDCYGASPAFIKSHLSRPFGCREHSADGAGLVTSNCGLCQEPEPVLSAW
jgi:hypothetical protein